MSLFPSIPLNRLSVTHHILRKCTSSDHNNFWCTYVNDDISSCFFLFFKILIFWAVRGVKWLEIAQNEKQQLHLYVMHHISGTIHHQIIIFCTHMYNDNISRLFFIFFKIFIFRAVRGVKGQKIAQNEKQQLHLCLSHTISQEPYII